VLAKSEGSANEECWQDPLYQTVIPRRSAECNEAAIELAEFEKVKAASGITICASWVLNVMPAISNMQSRDEQAISSLHW
jgi:hypothetical protein